MRVRSAPGGADRGTQGERVAGRPRRGRLELVLAAALLLGACGSDAPRAGDGEASSGAGDPCDWPMLGRGLDHTFAAGCPSAIDGDSVAQLGQAWFFNTDDVVTASPAVVDGSVYVGDWSGRFY